MAASGFPAFVRCSTEAITRAVSLRKAPSGSRSRARAAAARCPPSRTRSAIARCPSTRAATSRGATRTELSAGTGAARRGSIEPTGTRLRLRTAAGAQGQRGHPCQPVSTTRKGREKPFAQETPPSSQWEDLRPRLDISEKVPRRCARASAANFEAPGRTPREGARGPGEAGLAHGRGRSIQSRRQTPGA